MKRVDYFIKLEKEREKLYGLIDEALKNGVPIAKTDAIIKQSRKVDLLITKIQSKTD